MEKISPHKMKIIKINFGSLFFLEDPVYPCSLWKNGSGYVLVPYISIRIWRITWSAQKRDWSVPTPSVYQFSWRNIEVYLTMWYISEPPFAWPKLQWFHLKTLGWLSLPVYVFCTWSSKKKTVQNVVKIR